MYVRPPPSTSVVPNLTLCHTKVLLNSAAILSGHAYAETVDGIEETFATNHLGHFLLTVLILPRICAAATPSAPARIINVSSVGHSFIPFKLEEVGFEGGRTWGAMTAYVQSKNANILFSLELAKRLKHENILSFSLHPGCECLTRQ